jgi:hypothetical protein
MANSIIDLPEDLKAELKRVARQEGRTEADLILDGIRQVVGSHASPTPKIPLFESDDPSLAKRVDEILRGFGDR